MAPISLVDFYDLVHGEHADEYGKQAIRANKLRYFRLYAEANFEHEDWTYWIWLAIKADADIIFAECFAHAKHAEKEIERAICLKDAVKCATQFTNMSKAGGLDAGLLAAYDAIGILRAAEVEPGIGLFRTACLNDAAAAADYLYVELPRDEGRRICMWSTAAIANIVYRDEMGPDCLLNINPTHTRKQKRKRIILALEVGADLGKAKVIAEEIKSKSILNWIVANI